MLIGFLAVLGLLSCIGLINTRDILTVLLLTCFLILLDIIVNLDAIKQQRNNYMLYPSFSWESIDKVIQKLTSYNRKWEKLLDKRAKMREAIIKRAKREGKESVKFAEADNTYEELCKELAKYDVASEACRERYKFMLKSNTALLHGKEIAETDKGWWFDVLDDEMGLTLLGKAKERAEKIYQEYLKEVLVINLERENN